MAREERNTYTIHEDANIGEIKIADDVVAAISAFAAADVEGVSTIGGNTIRDIRGRMAGKAASKGVKVDVLEGIVTVSIHLSLVYGYSLVKVTAMVQDKVKNSIESMTGLTVADVNIRVTGVDVPEES